jgi:hypothetical protein
MGVWGAKGCKFIKNVGRQIKGRTMDKRSSSFLLQRGNCDSVMGTVESHELLKELFNLFETKPDLQFD